MARTGSTSYCVNIVLDLLPNCLIVVLVLIHADYHAYYHGFLRSTNSCSAPTTYVSFPSTTRSAPDGLAPGAAAGGEAGADGIVGGPRTPQQIAAQKRLQQTQAQVDEVRW